jgi:hypothetical protein
VTAQVRTILPVFWGICGWNKMIFIKPEKKKGLLKILSKDLGVLKKN